MLERPKALSKAALQQHLWPETFVAEANLSNLVAEIRDALADKPRKPASHPDRAWVWLRVLRATPSVSSESRQQSDERATCWLEWGRRRFALAVGENVVGRDPDVEVRLDASTVSRRHARVIVASEGTLLEDCGQQERHVSMR